MGSTCRAVTMIAIVAALSLTSTVLAQTSSPPLVTHGPIIVDGDSDLCNVDDLLDGQDKADGIINCNSADGSADRPYIISGWNVTWDPAGPCRVDPNPLICQPLPPCSTSAVPAAVAICGTRKHIHIGRLEIGNAEVARQTQEPAIPAAALVLSNVDNIRVYDVNARAGGIALLVESGKPVATLPAQTNPTIVDGFRMRSWTEHVESGIGLPPSLEVLPELSLLRVADSPVVLRRMNVDAAFRNIAITANASASLPLFELTDSLIANGSSTAGIELYDVDAVVQRNRFELIGVAGTAAAASNAIVVHGGNVLIRQNQFNLRGDGIELSSTPAGNIRENVFAAATEGMEYRVLKQFVGGCADLRFSYNDIPGASVQNGDAKCPLDARYNWWDGPPRIEEATGQDSGTVETNPPLSRSIGELPVVTIRSPANGTQVHGKLLLAGTVASVEGLLLDRVEASASESEWSLNQSVPAAAKWDLVWDVTSEALGPFSLFVRACAADDDCGLPATVDVLVIEKPLPPIAVFDASPRVVSVGQPVRLDASLSYSPQGRPLHSFRFDLGNSSMTGWQTSPIFEARFAEAGNYPTSVQVQDAQGLTSENLPQQIIRVQGAAANENGGFVPGAPFLAAVSVVSILAFLIRSRP